jgi:hypothetical protein
MRDDMAKVVTERPRCGHKNASRKTRGLESGASISGTITTRRSSRARSVSTLSGKRV